MTAGQTPDRPRRRRPWLIGALLVGSLAVNLFLGGLLLGGVLAGGGRPPSGSPFTGLMAFGQMAGALPGEGPAVLREAFVERREELHDHMRLLAEARREAQAAIAADPFDAERADLALANLRWHTAAIQRTLHEGLAIALAELTPEQREILAERLAGGRRGPGGGWGHWGRSDR